MTSKNGVEQVRHLTPPFALGALRRGMQIEQFLGAIEQGGQHGLRWIAISPGRTGFTVYLSDVEDVGSDTFLDITEFPPLDPDDETWGKAITTAADPEEAISLAERELGAHPERWVNQGVVCSEYLDYRNTSSDARPMNP
ncbi:hypothetical protein G5C51_01365 [Streptomyces sp. A7024]|uniref:Uncharacterized protein n=1 Tax=Streptomyces coryli TaxID=1128680 RepID=A0A6G4TU53_9ACTN|nr:hypothetical protein [Streptomyces coryli]NGN62557.1 hypothetical protein [Streptomyces coryli]